jgi:hypothetical protein
MRITKTIVGWSLCFVLMTPLALHAQETSPPDLNQACRKFVQGFYTWYARRERSWNEGLRKYAFSPELRRYFKYAEGELDFDPFLATNGDPYKRYVAGKVTVKGDRYWVAVYGRPTIEKRPKPIVTPEVMWKDGRWVFANFHYGKAKNPVDESILSVLRYYKKQRNRRQ